MNIHEFLSKSRIPTGERGTLSLAYIGDSVFQFLVKNMLLSSGDLPVAELNKRVNKLVCASSQAEMYHKIKDILTDTELSVLKRGRNASTSSRAKHASVSDYRHATGIETLFGFLYLEGQIDRLLELFSIIIIDYINF